MDFSEIKTKSAKELKELLAHNRNELRALKFKARNQQFRELHRIAEVKRTVARILTVLNSANQK